MKAVKVFKGKLITPTVLALPKSNGQYTTDTDACDTQVGCVLSQEHVDKILKPIGYWMRSLCDAEHRHDTTQKERLAVV